MVPLLLICGLLFPGVERGKVEFRPTAGGGRCPRPFRLPASDFAYELWPILKTPEYDVSGLRFDSPIKTADPENNIVPGDISARIGPASGRPWWCCTSSGPTSPCRGSWRRGWPITASRPCSSGFPTMESGGLPAGSGSPANSCPRTSNAPCWRCGKGPATSEVAACWLASRPEVDPEQDRRLGDQPGGDRVVGRRGDRSGHLSGCVHHGGRRCRTDPLGNARGRPLSKEVARVGQDPGRSQGIDRPVRPPHLRRPTDQETDPHVRREVDEVIPPDCTIALWELRRQAADPLV